MFSWVSTREDLFNALGKENKTQRLCTLWCILLPRIRTSSIFLASFNAAKVELNQREREKWVCDNVCVCVFALAWPGSGEIWKENLNTYKEREKESRRGHWDTVLEEDKHRREKERRTHASVRRQVSYKSASHTEERRGTSVHTQLHTHNYTQWDSYTQT